MKKILVYNSFSNMMPELIVWMIYLQNFGWSIAEIALLQGIFTFFSAIFEIPSGIIADKIGYKRALQLAELICIFYLISYFFPLNRMVIYIGFICFSLGLSLISGTDTSLLYNITDGNKFLKYMGIFNSLGIISVAFGNLIGGWIAEKSWTLLFLISLLFRVVALICITSFDVSKIREVEPIADNKKAIKLYLERLYDFVKTTKKFKYILVSSAFLMSSVTLSYQYMPVVLEQLSLTTGQVSLIYAIVSVLGSVLSFFSEKLTSKWSSRGVAVIIFFISLLLFLGIGRFPYHSIIVTISFMVPNILYELLSVIIDSTVHEDLRDDIRASSISLINFANSIMLTFGSILVSLLSGLFSLQITISLICTTLMLLSLLSYIEFGRR
ncbi:putative MFS Superfamliymultidrug-effluxtransporter [Streptococcus sp. HSISM1]|jgi:MFS family major facilitator transporter|nr:putative MFS Superfamliymultidrug-effluxtransporter [Streptococcus sp. HSISM1]